MENYTDMMEFVASNKLLLTILLLFIGYLFKKLIVKVIKKNVEEEQRLRINRVNNVFTFLLILLLLGVWSNELQKFALSIAAFVVAIVLATREFIQCFIGFIYILSSSPFRIGDWIQVGDTYGEVHSTDWAKLTLLEVDIETYQYTGKTLYVPNSQLLTSMVKNLNFLKRYAMHTFVIVRDASVNPFEFLPELEKKAVSYCADFSDVAHRYNQLIETRLDINIAGPKPQFQVATSDIGHTQVFVTIFCPTERALNLEQKITKEFMRLWFNSKPTISN